jgi:hypothetical protein
VVLTLRDKYRRAQLRDIDPDAARWTQLVGAAYDRQIIAFSVKTTPEQDDALISELNSRENRRRFNVFVRNCADFARDLISRYHPDSTGSSLIADLGFTVPKQIANAVVRYGARRPDAGLAAYLIPQIPGNRRDSRRARGVFESLLKTKKYSVPLAIVQPWVAVGLAAVMSPLADSIRIVMRACSHSSSSSVTGWSRSTSTRWPILNRANWVVIPHVSWDSCTRLSGLDEGERLARSTSSLTRPTMSSGSSNCTQ